VYYPQNVICVGAEMRGLLVRRRQILWKWFCVAESFRCVFCITYWS